jgi:nucleoside-diphosphate-sugar epimerase
VTISELVRAISEVAGRRPRLITDKTKPEGRPVKSANATRLRAAYPGFRKTVELQDGLRRMLAWYQTTFVST